MRELINLMNIIEAGADKLRGCPFCGDTDIVPWFGVDQKISNGKYISCKISMCCRQHFENIDGKCVLITAW